MPPASPDITPELLEWAVRLADRYSAAYGDADGRMASTIGHSLVRAARSFDPARGDFTLHLKRRVKSRLHSELKRRGARPLTLPLIGPGPATATPPVGWEIEHEDFVSSVADMAEGRAGDVIRTMFLDARGGSAAKAGAVHGLTAVQANNAYRWGIEKVRKAIRGREDVA